MNLPLPDRATAVKATGAIAATLLISLLFIASYAGALHAPQPRHVPLAVSAEVPRQVADRLAATDTFTLRRVADPRAAARAIDRRDAYGSLTVAGARRLTVTVAPAASAAIAQLLGTQLVDTLRQAGLDPTTRTVHALPDGDPRGLVGFYLGIGWVLAGYFGVSLLGLAIGTRLAPVQIAWRVGALAVLGLLAGVGGTLIASAIGDSPGGQVTTALIGMLTVLAVGTATMAFQSLLGVAGTGVAILLFVILGNPAAGGAAPPELLPGLWRVTGQLLPNGAAVTGIRDAAFFPEASVAGPVVVLLAWTIAGTAIAAAVGRRAKGIDERFTEASLVAPAA